MGKPIHILIVEDRKTDFDLAQYEIRKSVEDCVFQQVQTRKDFQNALDTFQPAVILSDYSLPHFDGITALKLAIEHAPLTPFIIWTGSLTEDVAVECMKAGANNYILKENIKRLGPTVAHALEEGRLLSERALTNEKLQESEKRFRALIENSLDNISLLAEDGTLLWENPAVMHTLGYEQDEFVGRNIFELMHPDDINWTTNTFTKLLKDPKGYERGTFRLRHQDGTWHWNEAIATNLLNEPSVGAIVINYRDVTKNEQAKLEIEQRNDDLGLLNALNEAVIRGDGMDTIVKLLGNELRRIFHSEECIIFMLSPDGKFLTMQQYDISPEVNRRIEQLIGGTIPLIQISIEERITFQTVLTSDHGVIIKDIETIRKGIDEIVTAPLLQDMNRGMTQDLASQIRDLLHIQSVIAIPLVSDQKPIGLLTVTSSNMFSEDDLKRIENIGKQLTAAIQSQQANEKIQKSEEFLQSVQNALSASIAILDEQGIIAQVNSAWRKFGELNGLKYPKSGIGLNYLDICDSATGPYAEEAPLVAHAIRDVIAGRRREALIEYPCHAPGEKRWFLLHITRFEDRDQTWVVMAHENITERKQTEDALKETSEQFRTLFEASPEAILLFDPKGNWPILDCNATACSMNGYTRDELIGQSVNIFNLTDGALEERTDYLKRVREAGILHLETLHRRKDGTIFPIEVSTSLITLGGREVILGIDRDITERKQAEEKLVTERNLLSTLIENIPDNVFVKDVNSRVVIDNAAHRTQLGIAALDEIVGTTDFDFFPKELASTYFTDEQNIIKSGQPIINKEEPAIHMGMGQRWLLTTKVPLRNSQGEITGILGINRDITERKQTETALRASEEKYRSLFEDVPIAIWEEDFSEVKNRLDSLKEQGITDLRAYFTSHPEIAFECLKLVKVLDVNNTALQMYEAGSKEDLINGTIHSLSLGEQEHALDNLIAVAEGRTKNAWEGSDETLTGKPIEISLHWSVVPGYEHDFSKVIVTTIDITERKRADQQLKRSHSMLMATLESTTDGILVVTSDRKISSFNRKFLELWRIPYGLAAKKDEHAVLEFVLDQLKDPSAFASKVEQLYLSSEDTSFDELEFADGRVYERYSQPQRLDDTIVGRVWSFRDITERKLAEEKLRESEIRFAGIVNTAMNAVISVDSEQRVVLFNPAAEQMFGCKASEALGQPLDRFIPDRYRDAHKKYIINFGQTEITNRAMGSVSTLSALHTDGTEFPIEASISHIEAGGQHLYTVILHDITERKQAEDALRARDELLYESQKISRLGHYDLDVSTGTWESSDTLDEILGIDKNFVRDVESWAHLVHPAQQDEMYSYLTKNILSEHNLFDREYKIVRKSDQQERWVHGLGKLEYDDDKNLIRMIGTIQDITERKAIEQALQQSEERYRQLLNVAPIGVGVHIDGKLVFANNTTAHIIGAKSSEETIGMPVMDFVHPEEREETIETLQRMLKGEQDLYPREERFIRLDGSIINVEVIATPLTYMDKPAVQVVIQDITERKQTEQEVKRHLAEMEALYENGLAVGHLLKPREIGERLIGTFTQYLSWHHVAIRTLKEGSDELELVAFSLPHMKEDERVQTEQNFFKTVNKVGQGLSGWVVQTGKPLRTGNVHNYQRYVSTYENIQSGLYMPLVVGERVIGVISVESEKPDAFIVQDERLLATLASQAAIAFENARLYQEIQQELAERRRAQKELRSSETHYRELADSITDIFFELNQKLHYTHWNKASEALTGIPEKDAIGKSMYEIFGDSEEQTRIGSIYRKVLETHMPKTFETTLSLGNQNAYFEINAYPSTRGVAVVVKDVTDRKRSESVIQKRFELIEFSNSHTLQELIQKTLDEVCDWTQSTIGLFQFIEEDQVNPKMQIWSKNTLHKFHGAERETMHMPADQAQAWSEAVSQRRAIIQNDYRSTSNKKDLPESHVPLMRELIVPIVRREKVVAVIEVGNKPHDYINQDIEITERFTDYAWDIMERKQMEITLEEERNLLARRVDERTADLSRANSNLARALRVKDEFLANMSHELRTPLNAILGLSESLAEQIAGPLNEKQKRYVTTIGESGHHLLSLINDILDLAKIEAGQITLDINKVNVHSVAESSLRMIKQMAQKKNQEVQLEVDPKIGTIWADERRLKQMLVNLLSNAVKFTPENGNLGLEIQGNKEENKVSITVWDNGIGISQNDLSLLFRPFVQLDSGLAREATGTGLGLALVAQMARLHGGSVTTFSEPGKGSRFTITLPWEPVTMTDVKTKLKNTGGLRHIDPDETNKYTILLVEDTNEVTMMIKDYLDLMGYKTVTAQDGIEGVAQAKLTHPDLILMDIQMPRMNGLEATQKLRAESEFKDTPIVALTALAMSGDREQCLAAGMNEYISKPVHLKALVKIIDNLLSAREEKPRY